MMGIADPGALLDTPQTMRPPLILIWSSLLTVLIIALLAPEPPIPTAHADTITKAVTNWVILRKGPDREVLALTNGYLRFGESIVVCVDHQQWSLLTNAFPTNLVFERIAFHLR